MLSVSRFVLLMVCLCGLLPVAAEENPDGNAVIFMYHRFGEERFPSTNIRLEQFEAQLDYLAKNDFTAWPLARLVEALQKRLPIPDKTVAITVDDAYLSVYTEAFPRLRERGWPFTVFVSPHVVDQDFQSYMSWKQMREMAAAGVDFGNHSGGHEHLIQRHEGESRNQWLARVKADLRHGQQRIRQELNIQARFLAYPYGEYNEDLAELVASMGLVALGQHSGAVGYGADLRVLPRYPVSEYYGRMESFKSKSVSLYFPVKEVQPFEPVRLDDAAPTMMVSLARPLERAAELQCYASGQGKVEVLWLAPGKRFLVKAPEGFKQRRGRYNCTIPSQQPGRFYWFSHLWIQPWLAEE